MKKQYRLTQEQYDLVESITALLQVTKKEGLEDLPVMLAFALSIQGAKAKRGTKEYTKRYLGEALAIALMRFERDFKDE